MRLQLHQECQQWDRLLEVFHNKFNKLGISNPLKTQECLAYQIKGDRDIHKDQQDLEINNNQINFSQLLVININNLLVTNFNNLLRININNLLVTNFNSHRQEYHHKTNTNQMAIMLQEHLLQTNTNNLLGRLDTSNHLLSPSPRMILTKYQVLSLFD